MLRLCRFVFALIPVLLAGCGLAALPGSDAGSPPAPAGVTSAAPTDAAAPTVVPTTVAGREPPPGGLVLVAPAATPTAVPVPAGAVADTVVAAPEVAAVPAATATTAPAVERLAVAAVPARQRLVSETVTPRPDATRDGARSTTRTIAMRTTLKADRTPSAAQTPTVLRTTPTVAAADAAAALHIMPLAPVQRGATATIQVSAPPQDICRLIVSPTGHSAAAPAFAPLMADGRGHLAWSWSIGRDLSPGNWLATVRCERGAGYSHVTRGFSIR